MQGYIPDSVTIIKDSNGRGLKIIDSKLRNRKEYKNLGDPTMDEVIDNTRPFAVKIDGSVTHGKDAEDQIRCILPNGMKFGIQTSVMAQMLAVENVINRETTQCMVFGSITGMQLICIGTPMHAELVMSTVANSTSFGNLEIGRTYMMKSGHSYMYLGHVWTLEPDMHSAKSCTAERSGFGPYNRTISYQLVSKFTKTRMHLFIDPNFWPMKDACKLPGSYAFKIQKSMPKFCSSLTRTDLGPDPLSVVREKFAEYAEQNIHINKEVLHLMHVYENESEVNTSIPPVKLR